MWQPMPKRLRWLTGFAGSWGMAILTLNKGAIFVDGRYTIQVRQQVDTKLFTPTISSMSRRPLGSPKI